MRAPSGRTTWPDVSKTGRVDRDRVVEAGGRILNKTGQIDVRGYQ